MSASQLRFSVGGHTEVGHTPRGDRQWSRNDDYLLVDLALGLFLVLDGSGNWWGPDERAKRGAEVIHQVVRDGLASTKPNVLIERAFQIAGESLRADLDEEGYWGATLVTLALFHDGHCYVSWLGDGMVHTVSKHMIEPVNWAHTVRNLMVRTGRLPENDEQEKRFSKICAYCLGGELPDPFEVVSFTPKTGDQLVLTTDGVHDVLDPAAMLAVYQSHPQPQACATRLIELARERGSNDNCTCVVVAFE